MVNIKQILDGSLLSRSRLMQAREQYAPSDGALSPEREFERWTERISVQSELAAAREIAGLSDAEMAAISGGTPSGTGSTLVSETTTRSAKQETPIR